MRIAVVGAMEAGSEKAHAINTFNMAQGFAKLGHDVILMSFAHRKGQRPLDKLYQQYDMRIPLRWVQFPRVKGKTFLSPDYPFARKVLFNLYRFQVDFVFARTYIAPVLSAKFGFPTVAESHAHTDNDTQPFLEMIAGAAKYGKFCKLITISEVLSQHYQSLGAPSDKMMVLPTGVDIERFSPSDEPSPYITDKPNVTYVGHLYDYKGIPTIIETAAKLPDVNFHLIGGMPNDIDRVQQKVIDLSLSNVTVHGFKSQSDIPPYLHHADILLLPPSLDHPSARWTSPVKLGEYLASGTPVIATRIPALEDWLTDGQVTFVTPDSATAMAASISDVLANPDGAAIKSEQGRQLAGTFSYQARAQTILTSCGF